MCWPDASTVKGTNLSFIHVTTQDSSERIFRKIPVWFKQSRKKESNHVCKSELHYNNDYNNDTVLTASSITFKSEPSCIETLPKCKRKSPAILIL